MIYQVGYKNGEDLKNHFEIVAAGSAEEAWDKVRERANHGCDFEHGLFLCGRKYRYETSYSEFCIQTNCIKAGEEAAVESYKKDTIHIGKIVHTVTRGKDLSNEEYDSLESEELMDMYKGSYSTTGEFVTDDEITYVWVA